MLWVIGVLHLSISRDVFAESGRQHCIGLHLLCIWEVTFPIIRIKNTISWLPKADNDGLLEEVFSAPQAGGLVKS